VFVKVDIDEAPDVSEDLVISLVPQCLYFQDGEQAKQVVGDNIKAIQSTLVETFKF